MNQEGISDILWGWEKHIRRSHGDRVCMETNQWGATRMYFESFDWDHRFNVATYLCRHFLNKCSLLIIFLNCLYIAIHIYIYIRIFNPSFHISYHIYSHHIYLSWQPLSFSSSIHLHYPIIQILVSLISTLPETNTAPENGPSQKESSLPTTNFQGLR